ncbi:hypothetical protein M422DRAFT_240746 [Sphaerobolus stellatus SS14]|nr:hypothetical protein M422DRAFT_240746 [Sphaerobolus stellatus SS14]
MNRPPTALAQLGLSVHSLAKDVVEFRVLNPGLLSTSTWFSVYYIMDVSVFAIIIRAWFTLNVVENLVHLLTLAGVILVYIFGLRLQVLYESIIIIPSYGVQIEVHNGIKLPLLSPLPLSTHRRFIPVSTICDVVINEALHRWNVRYYACIISDVGDKIVLDVLFQNLLPRFPILEYVYNQVHELLLSGK